MKTLAKRTFGRTTLSLIFEPRDLWMGVFVDTPRRIYLGIPTLVLLVIRPQEVRRP